MKLLSCLFRKPDDPRDAMRALWQRVIAIAREPRWYAEDGVADTPEGRFDMITAVLALVMLRLEKGRNLVRDSALLTELFVEDMDAQLRELGVGDLVVGRKVGRLVGSLGGRIGAYRDGVSGGAAAMREAVERNITLAEGGSAPAVSENLLLVWQRLERAGDATIRAGEF